MGQRRERSQRQAGLGPFLSPSDSPAHEPRNVPFPRPAPGRHSRCRFLRIAARSFPDAEPAGTRRQRHENRTPSPRRQCAPAVSRRVRVRQPRKAMRHAGPEAGRRPGRRPRPHRPQRRPDRRIPPRRDGAAGPGLQRGRAAQPRAGLCFPQRIRPDRPLCAAARPRYQLSRHGRRAGPGRQRPGDAGRGRRPPRRRPLRRHVRAVQHAGRLDAAPAYRPRPASGRVAHGLRRAVDEPPAGPVRGRGQVHAGRAAPGRIEQARLRRVPDPGRRLRRDRRAGRPLLAAPAAGLAAAALRRAGRHLPGARGTGGRNQRRDRPPRRPHGGAGPPRAPGGRRHPRDAGGSAPGAACLPAHARAPCSARIRTPGMSATPSA